MPTSAAWEVVHKLFWMVDIFCCLCHREIEKKKRDSGQNNTVNNVLIGGVCSLIYIIGFMYLFQS